MTRRQRRMAAVAALLLGVASATALGLVAFRKNVMYYLKPSELLAQNPPPGTAVELGGMVESGSLKHGDGLKIQFVVTDCSGRVPVRYEGVLPDLFREGQGVIATGHLDPDHAFVASRILAKHDENYMPPDVARTMHVVNGKPTCTGTAGTAGTGDSGLGTREKQGVPHETESQTASIGTGALSSRPAPAFAVPRVPSPESRVPAFP